MCIKAVATVVFKGIIWLDQSRQRVSKADTHLIILKSANWFQERRLLVSPFSYPGNDINLGCGHHQLSKSEFNTVD